MNIVIIIIVIISLIEYYTLLKKKQSYTESFSQPLQLQPVPEKRLSIPKCISDCKISHQSYPNGQPSCKVICPPKVSRYYNENLMQYN